jgi:hypothetical protein
MHDVASPGNWLLSILVRIIDFIIVVVLVWMAYVYLYAYQPDFLGWAYSLLRPITIWLYQIVDVSLPEAVKYKVSAGLTDELGPRALFLLVLAGIGHLLVSSVLWIIGSLFRAATRRA